MSDGFRRKSLLKYRKIYNNLSRRQQLRRLREQRNHDYESLSSSLQTNENFSDEKNCHYSCDIKENIDHVDTNEQVNIDVQIEAGTEVNTSTNTEEVNDYSFANVDMDHEEQNETDFWDKENLYSDDENGDLPLQSLTLWENVATWALRNYKNRNSINEILHIFREAGHNNLPKDSRTLLGTPRTSSNIVTCGSGSYLHYGLERALTDSLKKIPQNAVPSHILIDINIDGLPLCKSSKSQLWPILGKIAGTLFPTVFVIGAYHGYEKPSSIDEFLNSFIVEYEKLKNDVITYDEKSYTVSINFVICDSPARSMVTCTKSHNGYFACPRCIDEGDYVHHRMCFFSTSSQLRTDNSFSLRLNKEHHTAISPFEKVGLKMVSQFPLDVMHLRDLGIMKKKLKLLLTGAKKAGKLSAKEISQMSELIISLGAWIPCEFVRKPRSLDEVDRWKAVESRLFLHYLGPLVFSEMLSEEYALHFNALHAALSILCHPTQYKENNKCAEDLLKWYVESFKILYGEENVVFTVHCIQHLSQEALRNGPLDTNTAYPFENHMQVLKKMIHRPKDPLPQLFRKFVEIAQCSVTVNMDSKLLKYPQFSKPYEANLPFGCSHGYAEINYSNFKLLTKQPNNYCHLKDGSIVCIKYIARKRGKPVIIGKKFTGLKSFPHYPGNSQDLDFHVATTFSDTRMFPVHEIQKKAVVLPLRNQYYILPLMHTSSC